MKVIIDSYAWIEYLDGTPAGLKVREILKGDNEVYTLHLNISEVISRVKRKGGDIETAYKAMISNSNLINLNSEISKETGLLHAEIRKKIKDFGLVDCYILLFARKINAKILTGDPHFKGFKEAILIK